MVSSLFAAIATALAGEGATITLMGRDQARLKAKAGELSGETQVSAVNVDVSNEESVAAAFARAHAKHGPVQILINNAGIAASAPFVRTEPELWAQMLAVNLTGTYLCSRPVIPSMLENGFGRVVNIASTAGLIGYAYVSAYCAAKHGIIGLTRALALEMGSRDITVNAVCPGFTDTDLVASAVSNIVRTTHKSEAEARAVGQNRVDGRDIVGHQTVTDRLAAAGIVGRHAADGAARMRRRIDREEQVV